MALQKEQRVLNDVVFIFRNHHFLKQFLQRVIQVRQIVFIIRIYVPIKIEQPSSFCVRVMTNQYGFYRFVDLYPATYTLRVTVPQEVKPTRRRQDLPMIASVLQESDEVIAYSIPLTVVSDRSNYNADLGFECLMDGVLPAGAGEGRTQVWTPKY